ncbi:nucleolar protein 8 [Elysia marginata]|uniref:Nucleolar protein 8 n=1 Tax=Elysia marginata TaxID=1093978 RepID=A0AAV4FA92_9GAST|nr:nucleolar protein 8 [Elysia marginata]
MVLSKRLFIGGLSENVSESELLERFSRFGKVTDVSLKTRIDEAGAPLKSFAHLNLQGDEASIKKCFSTYQNAKWKGSVMKLQYAKESVLERAFDHRPFVVPSKDWVVGKYGRAVPVLKLKKSYKIPMVKHDPSKYCHAAKVFKDEPLELAQEGSCTKLTWEIDEPDSAITKKRKGEFPENSLPKKKKAAINATTERDKLLPFSTGNHNNRTAFSPMTKENDELEVVKIGAVIRKSKSANISNISNKFDSDIESDSENGPQVVQSQLKPVAAKKPNRFGTSPESGYSLVSQKNNRFKNPVGDEPDKNHKGDENLSSNRAGIPEFKGLSMIAGLDEPSIVFAKPGNGDVNTTSLTKTAGTSLSNGFPVNKNQALSSPSSKSTVYETADSQIISLKDSVIIAKPVEDAYVATPAPFITTREHNIFKTSTPNAPFVPSKQGSAPKAGDESQSFKNIPKFKGLGILTDYNVEDNMEEISLKLEKQKKEKVCVSAVEDSSLPSDSLSSKISKQLENKIATKRNSKSLTNSSPALSSKATQEGSAKKSKVITDHQDHDTNGDSDSSAGTDEIILRHKEQKSSNASLHSKPEGPVKQPVLAHKLSKDNNLQMSEFVSGVDEFGEAQGPCISPAHRNSNNDSYDSDLDSNDFALVAKKLRRRAMLSNQIPTEKRKNSTPQKGKAMSLTNETKGKEVSNLQTKLINIAGLEVRLTIQ